MPHCSPSRDSHQSTPQRILVPHRSRDSPLSHPLYTPPLYLTCLLPFSFKLYLPLILCHLLIGSLSLPTCSLHHPSIYPYTTHIFISCIPHSRDVSHHYFTSPPSYFIALSCNVQSFASSRSLLRLSTSPRSADPPISFPGLPYRYPSYSLAQ